MQSPSYADRTVPQSRITAVLDSVEPTGSQRALDDAAHTVLDLPTAEDEPTMLRGSVPTPDEAGAAASAAMTQQLPQLDDHRTPPLPLPAVRHAASPRDTSSRGCIGKYEVREKLGRGAFGVVYTARDPSLDRDIAIKVLRPTHLTNANIVHRFLKEARATARIAHPGIVTIHDCGQVETSLGTTAFIAMELLSGESLAKRLLRCGRLAAPGAVEIVRQIASALEAAHRVDVLHRDLKPDNIHLVPDPATPTGERVKVLDFGLCKLGDGGITQVQTVFGTPRYMSPEQYRSATQIDHRSDIYSLGIILFELITGNPPFDGDLRQLIEQHQHVPAPRTSSLVPDLPAGLDNLIANMLAKDPMDRPQTMGAVQRALQRIAEAPSVIVELSVRTPSEPVPIVHIGSGPQPLVPPSGPQVSPSDPRAAPSAPQPRVASAPHVLDPNVSGELLVPAPAGGAAARRSAARPMTKLWQQLRRPATLATVGGLIIVASAVLAWLTAR